MKKNYLTKIFKSAVHKTNVFKFVEENTWFGLLMC